MMEAKETQPPEMPTGPRCTMTARSNQGLKMPIKKAKGAASSTFLARYPGGRLPTAMRATG